MGSRENILGRIRKALGENPGQQDLPEMIGLWPDAQNSPDAMLTSFETALTAVAGECLPCATIEEAVAKSQDLFQQLGAKKIGIVDRPWIREISAKMNGVEQIFRPDSPENVSPESMAQLDVGIIQGEFLLADTGSCVVASPTAFDRMLCYIPPVCLVFAQKSVLRPHLQAAWPEISARMINPDDPAGTMNRSGEFLIVTGPSRTADIEKILILGVHGPKRIIVFMID